MMTAFGERLAQQRRSYKSGVKVSSIFPDTPGQELAFLPDIFAQVKLNGQGRTGLCLANAVSVFIEIFFPDGR